LVRSAQRELILEILQLAILRAAIRAKLADIGTEPAIVSAHRRHR
jgi:hypothetical protein